LKARLLGSGGFVPTERRATACLLVRRAEAALLLDAGTGLSRLVSDPDPLAGAETLDIVLTHFHHDHVAGLAYTPALSILPTIWAPGRWLYDRDSATILGPMRSAPLSPFSPDELGDVRELMAGQQEIGPFTITARRQDKHWHPTAGIRVDDVLTLITDTAYDAGSVELAAGAAHLLHEAWATSAEAEPNPSHATAAEAARVAATANVGQLTLIHLNPHLQDESALREDARRHMPNTVVGEDGLDLAL
jgi:ribonuclease BN (tRNA processing enzyme)